LNKLKILFDFWLKLALLGEILFIFGQWPTEGITQAKKKVFPSCFNWEDSLKFYLNKIFELLKMLKKWTVVCKIKFKNTNCILSYHNALFISVQVFNPRKPNEKINASEPSNQSSSANSLKFGFTGASRNIFGEKPSKRCNNLT